MSFEVKEELEKRTIKNIAHYVYDDIDEFREHHPNTVVHPDWKIADEDDWVYSDDDRIIQLLKVAKQVNHPNDRKNYKYSKGWCRTVVGTFLMNSVSKMDTDFSAHKNRYTFSKTIGKKGNVRKRKNPTKKEKLFTTSIVAGHGPVKAYMDAFGEQNDKSAKRKAVILLKQERIVKEIERSVMDVAKENGADAIKFQTYITEKRIHKKYKKIFNILKKCELKFKDFQIIKDYCKHKKILFFSTPFDKESVNFLNSSFSLSA